MNNDTSQACEAVVIGGGPAGITAALYLARFKRSVALLDANESRLGMVPLSHNYPGFADGVSGSRLLAAMKAQLQPYPVRWRQDRVLSVARHESGFVVRGESGTPVFTQLVLLATGVADIPPPLPHVRDALRQGALRYCPVCDGFEVSGRTVGVYADGPSGVAEAIYLRHFTPQITVFVEGGGGTLAPADRQRLHEAGIALALAPVRGIRHTDGRVTVSHGGRESVCDSLYCALGLHIRSELAVQMGAACDEDGYVEVDGHGATTQDGVFAVGDVARGLNQIAVATGGAAIAASAMHSRLLAAR